MPCVHETNLKIFPAEAATFEITSFTDEIKKCGYDVILKNTFLPSRDRTAVTRLVEQGFSVKNPGWQLGKHS